MINRFEKLTIGVTQIYKDIQKIKKHKMNSLGLKGTHAMCLYYLDSNPAGCTAADLSGLCREDKGSISRILSDLERIGFIRYDAPPDAKRYRTKAQLTEDGRRHAAQVNEFIIDAVLSASQDISEEDRQIFYRVLFTIADNLNQICDNLNQ